MNAISERSRQFSKNHQVCDMLGFNLCHPRFLVDNVDLGEKDETTCRGDFPKLADWGISVAMAKGGVATYSAEFADLWRRDPTRRPGRYDEEMYLSLAVKSATQIVMSVLDRLLVNVEKNPDKVMHVRTAGDLDVAREKGLIAILMGANRSDWFGDSPGVLRMFARLGLRMITIGQSARELGWDTSGETRSGGRMTELGVRMIQEMNSCGILIDLAHSNDPCALDVIEVSEKPVIDSHSNPRRLSPGDRSAPDEVMKALAEAGGMLGITPAISRPDGDALYTSIDPEQTRTTLDHIRYAVDLMGIEHVGIGTHFNTAIMPFLTDALLDDGFSEAETAAIMGGNYLRILRRVLPE
jgi:membrane dipeptidase